MTNGGNGNGMTNGGNGNGMTNDEIFTRVRELLAKRFNLDPARIVPEARLFQDLDLDSIDAIDMVVEMQMVMGWRLPEESLRSIRTIADVVTTIESFLAAGGAEGGPAATGG
jgi:acyl carrier protein